MGSLFSTPKIPTPPTPPTVPDIDDDELRRVSRRRRQGQAMATGVASTRSAERGGGLGGVNTTLGGDYSKTVLGG